MKLYKKVLVGVATIGLSTAAAFPYVKGYLDNLPKHLTTEQAGKAYLDATCPINKYVDYLETLKSKHDHEMSMRYPAGSEALARANQRTAELGLRTRLAFKGYGKSMIQASKVFSNPKVVWPDAVKKDVKAYSVVLFTDGGLVLAEDFKGVASTINKTLPSKIRHSLSLPPIGQGCKPTPQFLSNPIYAVPRV